VISSFAFAAATLLAEETISDVVAASKNRLQAARTQLAAKADVNAAQPDGSTALHWAAHHDDLETARLLLDAGANPKAANRYGMTPLHLACTNGNGPLVELLLAKGADANATLPGGETALMTAARTGRLAAVKALLAKGADPNAKESKRGQNAIMWAAAEGHAEVVETLIAAKANFRLALDSGFTPLFFAAREGHAAVVRVLLKAGVDVNETLVTKRPPNGTPSEAQTPPRQGETALLLAMENAHFDLAAELLDAGANPNAIGPGWAPLHVVSWLRKPGVGDNDPAPFGSGKTTSLEIVRKLIEKGADINIRMTKKVGVGLTAINTIGATPFFLAARTADAELIRFLAKLGADPKINNRENSTPLMAAAGLGTRSPGEDAGTDPEVVEAIQALLELGADINAVDDNGETAMHAAAYKNAPVAVEFLAAHGAKPEIWNKPNKEGWTPLRIAEGYRFGNYKPSPVTVAAFERIMNKPAGTQ
jgi:uncharacterized protein